MYLTGDLTDDKKTTPMILAHDAILAAIRNNRIRIDPFSERAVGPASIDLTLGNEIRSFRKTDTKIPILEETDHKEFTVLQSIDTRFAIRPGELALGVTVETITLPSDICGWLNTRSRFARLGLMVHATAPFIQPGVSNRQVLEIFNAGPNTLELVPGEKLCHLILEETTGGSSYEGIFKQQKL